MKNLCLFFLLLVNTLIFAQATGNSPEVGITDGQLSVSLTGSAVYEMPISVPPGVKGLVPQISLNYNSQGGNGLAGYGWDLSGISVIKKVSATKFHDNTIDAVDYDALDRFAIDGQRLMLTQDSPGVYGADNAVYETESFSNLRITSYGIHPNGVKYGPAYFIVRYPDGSIAEYGNTSTSRTNIDYAINYWQDPQGNRIIYTYSVLNNNLSIEKITYGSNVSIVNAISFYYDLRVRNEQSSIGDVNYIRSNILKSIRISSGSTDFKNYYLDHDITSLGYQRLIRVTEKTGHDGLSYNPTEFTYDTTTNSNLFEAQPSTAINLSDVNYVDYSNLSGDYDGNGITDIIIYKNSVSEKNKFWLYKSLQSDTDLGILHNVGAFDDIFTTTQLTGTAISGYKIAPKQGWVIIQPPLTANATRFRNYLLSDSNTIQEQYAKQYAFPQFNTTTIALDYSGTTASHLKKIEKRYLSGDFNGDGLTDLLAIEPVQIFNNSTYEGNVYFVNLDKRMTTNFVNISGQIQFTEAYGKLKVGDVNGDGKDELLVIRNGSVRAYTLNDNNQLSLINEAVTSTIKFDKMILFGDFNGDRKMDFVTPQALNANDWVFFTSTGSSFSTNTLTLPFGYVETSEGNFSNVGYGGGTFKALKEINYVANDYNGDGKTDILIQQNLTAICGYVTGGACDGSVNGLPLKTMFGIMENISNNTNSYTFNLVTTHAEVTGIKRFPIPVFSNANQVNTNLEYTLISGNQIRGFKSPKDNREDVLLRVITNGNGVKETITYSPLKNVSCGSNCNSVYLPQIATENYPNIDVIIAPTLKVVSKLEQQSTVVYKKQLFAYSGAVSNLDGLGFLGFKALMRTNWHNDTTNIISNITTNSINLRGANFQNYSISGLVMPQLISYINYISKSTNTYNAVEEPPLLSNKVFKLKKTKIEQYNGLENTSSVMSITYDLYNNPIRVLTNLKEGTSLVQTSTNEVTYDNQPTGSTYIIGRTLSEKQSINSVPDYDLDFSESFYSYNNNLLTQIKKRGNNTEFITEDNQYDAFGNITTKTVTASGLAPRITKYEYSSASPYFARFLTKSYIIDNGVEKLARQFTYNSVSGNLLTESDSYGNTTTHEYDKWHKLLKTTEVPGKIVTISYTKPDQTSSLITIDGNDSSSMMAKYDDLGRKIIEGVKQVNDTWSYIKMEYDIYDRMIAISEPYSSLADTPSKWNTTTYDSYGRQNETITYNGKTTTITYSGLTTTTNDGIKAVTTTKDAVGNVVLMNEGSSSVIYKYFPNGNLKSSDYDGVKIEIEQDGWGRRKKLIDPSAGTYTYNYNHFGDILQEATPNGQTDYLIGDWGEVKEKTVVGLGDVATDTKSIYTYETDTKQLKKIEFKDFTNGLGIDYSFGYDQYKRLNLKEESGYMAFYQQAIQYDNYGRPEKELYAAVNTADNKSSIKWIKNTFKNGHPYQLIDESANNKVLWQTNAVNERGQLTSAIMGNGMRISRMYDQYGFPTQIKYFKSFIGKPAPPNVDYLTLNYSFESATANLKSRSNSSFGFNEIFNHDNLDRLIEYTNSKGAQEFQSYDNRGRITANNIGNYNYSSAKPYRNNSIEINAEATAYFQNREGIFNDGMEEKKAWVNYEPASISFDDTKSHTGTTSLKINNTSAAEKMINSEVWVPIDNAVDTQYNYSVWVYSTAPQAEIFMFMKTENEANPWTSLSQTATNITNQWFLLEGTVLVPANIKKLNIRLDNNGLGTIWFDDVRIKKTGNAATALRELNISYNVFKAPVQIEETGVDKISFVYNEAQGRSSMFYGGLQTDKMQRQFRKHYSTDGSMEIKQNTATGKVEFITYIGGDGYSAPVVLKSDGTTEEYLYLLRDYQGSILEIYNDQSIVLEKRIFDAWGNLIKVQDGQGSILSKMAVLDRGYTGHEHLQGVGLIHMNGRLYDPILHRFLQPDNDILDPSNTQNYNRYGYVLNNPLKYTDPTGENQTSDNTEPGANGWYGLAMGAASYIGQSWDKIGMKDGIKDAGNWLSNNLKDIGDWFSNNWKSIFGGGSGGSKMQTFPPTSASFLSNYGNGNEFNSFQSYSLQTGYNQNVQIHPYIAASVSQSAVSESVGQPGDWESVIPVWGSGRAAVDHFQNGNYWRGIGYSALAISDVFLVKAAYTAIAKGITVAGTKIAASKGIGLSDDVAKTFRFGRYTETVLDKPVVLSRYYDNVNAFAKGRYMTNSISRFTFLDRMGLALRPGWNRMTKVAHWEIPAGTTIYRGKAAMQFPWFGGKTQYFIPELEGIIRLMK